ncbi:hypothetical protein GTW43_36420, partial [Streptomyces sp. SID5785]|uniref:hypothetical protein n=1 Tax=Streptomyces sp. SID5785 TaxID=2690309 RepID=UPI0013614A94
MPPTSTPALSRTGVRALWGAVLVGLLLSLLGGPCARSAAAAAAGPAEVRPAPQASAYAAP